MINILKERLQVVNTRKDFEPEDMPAAVMVPLLEKEGKYHVLFQVRGKELRRQPGQISFPGGKYESSDISPWEAAKRETMEELGLASADIEYIGDLDYYPSPIGVKIYPFVGKLHSQDFRLNSAEVDEVFCVALEDLLAMEPRMAVMQVGTSPVGEFPFDLLPNYNPTWKYRKSYEVYFYPYKKWVIWGLTGTVLKNFLDIYRKIM